MIHPTPSPSIWFPACMWPGPNDLLLKNRKWKKWVSLPRLGCKNWLPSLLLAPSHLPALRKQATMHGRTTTQGTERGKTECHQSLRACLQGVSATACCQKPPRELGSRPCPRPVPRWLQPQLTPDGSLVSDPEPEDQWSCAQIPDPQNDETVSAWCLKLLNFGATCYTAVHN